MLSHVLAAQALLLLLGLAAPAYAADPEAVLEQAARCLRRGDLPCAERHAESLLVPTTSPELAREAAAIALAAIARADRPADAAAACERLLTIWPGYTPPPDADPRIAAACEESKRRALAARLPPEIAPPPAPLPELGAMLPAPALYAPARLTDLEGDGPPLSLSIGAGIGVPLGASSDRYEPGVHAALDLRLGLAPRWSLWLQATLALMKLTTTLPIEPHEPTSLTAFTVTAGAELALPLADRLELVLALGLGLGGFGLRGADEAMGLAIAPDLGVRYRLDENLAARLDLAPVLVLPVAAEAGPGGHLAFILRGEATF